MYACFHYCNASKQDNKLNNIFTCQSNTTTSFVCVNRRATCELDNSVTDRGQTTTNGGQTTSNGGQNTTNGGQNTTNGCQTSSNGCQSYETGSRSNKKSSLSVWRRLAAAYGVTYRRDFTYWYGVELVRRTILVCLSTLLIDPLARAFAVLVYTALALLLHTHIAPYRLLLVNRTHTTALAGHVLIAG